MISSSGIESGGGPVRVLEYTVERRRRWIHVTIHSRGNARPRTGDVMDYQAILFDIEDQVATITLNRPERMNSFSDELLSEWADAIIRCQDDDDVRVVIVTGAGRAFCAGADLRATGDADVLMQEYGPGERRNSLRYSVHRVPQALEYLDREGWTLRRGDVRIPGKRLGG